MPEEKKSVIDPNAEASNFIKNPDEQVKGILGILRVTISVGELGCLLRNKAVEKYLSPGQHVWFNFSPFNEYSMARIDAREKLWTIETQGTVKGPAGGNNDTPPCRIKLPVSLSVKVRDINQLLNTESPIRVLSAMINNFVATNIGKLRYDQENDWANEIRTSLEAYLQGTSVIRTGIQVLEVYIDEPIGQSEADRRQLALFRTTSGVKAASVRILGMADITKQKAEALKMKPSLLEMVQTPNGMKLIELNVELQKLAMMAGVLPGNPDLLQPNDAPQQPTIPPPTNTVPPPAQNPYGSGQSGPPKTGEAHSIPNPNSGQGVYPSVMQRVRDDIAAMPIAPAQITRYPTLEPSDDGYGRVAREFHLQVRMSWGMVECILPAGYPDTPPTITIADAQGMVTHYPVGVWSRDMLLANVLQEIGRTRGY